MVSIIQCQWLVLRQPRPLDVTILELVTFPEYWSLHKLAAARQNYKYNTNCRWCFSPAGLGKYSREDTPLFLILYNKNLQAEDLKQRSKVFLSRMGEEKKKKKFFWLLLYIHDRRFRGAQTGGCNTFSKPEYKLPQPEIVHVYPSPLYTLDVKLLIS